MTSEAIIHFPPFRLDCATEQLWQGTQQIPLRPKPFAVLRHLAQHPNRLVTKEELLKAVWPETCVSEGLLHTYIRDLRQALRDDPETPRFIETVARRGYRFIASLTTPSQPVQSLESKVQSSHSAFRTPHSAFALVGREPELAQLHQWLDKALQGERHVVFVTGAPGIGKTTVVEAFLQSLESRVQRLASKDQTPQPHTVQTLDPRRQTLDANLWIGRGQCIEHYGAGEAYLPVLEALGRLCREPQGAHVIEVLRRHAPTWLVQMPSVVREEEYELLQRKVQGMTQERRLREMAEAVMALTAERPLVLWLEDLQWSDYSTLDLLSALARLRDLTRLLMLGTYRPTDVIISGHPLKAVKQELQIHGFCTELPLGFLRNDAVAEYLARRFPGGEVSPRLAPVVHRSTEGNPLFMVNVAEYVAAQGGVSERAGHWQLTVNPEAVVIGVPESLRQMIEKQVERLTPDEQRVLEVASVAGREFSAGTVAAGLAGVVESVEAVCEEIVRLGHFLQSAEMETLPDGTVTGRYCFLHTLYQSVLYERVAAARRSRLHRRIGEREEAVYGNQGSERAAELALHFERGQDYARAVQYLGQAAERAIQRAAYREAIDLLRKGLDLLPAVPHAPARVQHEITLQTALGAALMATAGYGAPEVEQAYARARELRLQVGDDPHLFSVVYGLVLFHGVRAELPLARECAEQALRMAQDQQDPALLLTADLLSS